jgi:hypothetical protein
MLGCVVLAAAHLVGMVARIAGLAAGWYPAYFVGACALAALEAYYGRRTRRRWEQSVEGFESWKLVALEVLAFLVVLKLGSYVGQNPAEIWADVQSWAQEPARILEGQTLLAVILAGFSWLALTQTLEDLENLKEAPEFWSDAQSGARGMPVPQARLARRFLVGGIVLLVVTALTWVGAHATQGWAGLGTLWSATFASRDAAAFPVWQAVNVLLYFCLGLVTLSQVRLVVLHQDWAVQKAAVGGGIERAWWRYSLAFVGLVAVVALLLPTGYTTGLLDVLRYGLAVVLHAAYTVITTLMVLVTLPFFLLARWILGAEVAAPTVRPQAGFRPPVPPPTAGGPAWLEIARALFFWLVLLGLVAWLARGFLRQHPKFGQALSSYRLVRWLVQLWRAWRARLAAWQKTRARRRRGRILAVEGERAGPALSVGGKPESNRRRVLYYYMDILRRARRAGYPRRPAQTPLVYGATLEERLPEARREVELLTESFLEARYSRHPIESELVRRVREGWRQIVQRLGGQRGDRD